MRLVGTNMQQAIEAQADIFGRDNFAAGLLNLFENSEDPLVVALDEKWGTGKTVFSKRLEKSALDQGFTVVYFDAFKRDYDPDVFIALSAELLAKLPDSNNKTSIKDNAKIVGKTILKIGLKSALRVGTAGALRVGDLNDAAEEAAEEIGDVAEAELDALIDRRLDSARVADETFESFKNSLRALANSSEGEGREAKPLLFIVDELDRCRPDYSLDVLETIKHFFSASGVHFLLVCDMDQLVSSIQHRYGLKGHGYDYLEKFIDVRTSFPRLDNNQLEQSMGLLLTREPQMPDDKAEGRAWNELSRFITRNFLNKGYSLRKIEKIVAQFSIVMYFMSENDARIDPLIILLCDLKISHPEIFKRAKDGQITFEEIDDIYNIDDNYSRSFRSITQVIFGSQPDHERLADLSSFSFRYNLDSAEQIRDYLIRNVIERIAV